MRPTTQLTSNPAVLPYSDFELRVCPPVTGPVISSLDAHFAFFCRQPDAKVTHLGLHSPGRGRAACAGSCTLPLALPRACGLLLTVYRLCDDVLRDAQTVYASHELICRAIPRAAYRMQSTP
jgi:hypothetical protein